MFTKKNQNQKKSNIIFREIKSYKNFWSYKSSTKNLLGKKIGISDIKELIKTYKTLEEPEISFSRSMEVDGIVEKDLHTAHSRYNIVQILFILLFLYPMYMFIDTILKKINGLVFELGFLPSLSISVVSMALILSYYIYFNWIQWRIRNRKLILPSLYFKILLHYPSQILPINTIEDTMENIYGKKWFNKIKK